mmetsp:Transcript_17709/g.41654  ORF Transcript_17709/g.41654 Transcript_17709/m.41654 type:complete len:224 (-) Transcript_17709:84-755(-)|eukprot:CAMPEP_0114554538 /NCGR_PEP_ID=MMETSP0114-20121206/8263_1 /TAXON_ID=31324 /ORGANISM="Goniomonas sp, Strain m" /LENGTH=223 /DNA_ID=CAMNT_0001739591 /DNA_START=81 /DNA_END=752 /DNA_ORIENTATION=+
MGVPQFLEQEEHQEQKMVSFELEEPRDQAHMKTVGERERLLIPMLAHVLEALVLRNDKLGLDKNVTAFHALKTPAVTINDYVERIRKYSACSPCCFVVGLVFMDRYLQRNPAFVLSSLSVHRLLLTCVLLAAKFLDDFYYNNAFWAKVGGVPVLELNALELELLFKLNFDLHVTTEEYLRYRKTLLAGSQGVEKAKQNGLYDVPIESQNAKYGFPDPMYVVHQ